MVLGSARLTVEARPFHEQELSSITSATER